MIGRVLITAVFDFKSYFLSLLLFSETLKAVSSVRKWRWTPAPNVEEQSCYITSQWPASPLAVKHSYSLPYTSLLMENSYHVPSRRTMLFTVLSCCDPFCFFQRWDVSHWVHPTRDVQGTGSAFVTFTFSSTIPQLLTVIKKKCKLLASKSLTRQSRLTDGVEMMIIRNIIRLCVCNPDIFSQLPPYIPLLFPETLTT